MRLMPPDEEQSLYDATIVLTFPAESIEDANTILDILLDSLEYDGYELGPATLEESVKLETT